ncbi:uncharacterized protein LOC130621394 [Hydractinia symbiolongicarpus]|uniref:uncharacterized protein LOC130621394 n=1 Tax=Hydractinia symbiolongicarpus TaxID=13093 RepID=UPI00254EF15E|nr:uncharacterized protein LOC130621394 [Hydractinia symbiolongicarpus]
MKRKNYLSLSQSAFRQNRSTSDAVWTHRWLVARIEKYQEKIYITGIDMSSAFDTIKRDDLLNILGNVINEDELRLIRFLLANTNLEIRMKDVDTTPFPSNIGSPQGDGISGCLFNIYFESSLRKVRKILEKDHILDEHSYSKRNESLLPVTEVIYADDYDHITDDINKKKKFNNIIKETLAKDNLLVNETKTEHTLLERKKKVNNETNEPWRHVKKLGSKP